MMAEKKIFDVRNHYELMPIAHTIAVQQDKLMVVVSWWRSSPSKMAMVVALLVLCSEHSIERGEGNKESGREGVRHEGGGKVVPRGSGE